MKQNAEIWIHVVWRTDNRSRQLDPQLIDLLSRYLKSLPPGAGFYVDTVNAVEDHVHVIVNLSPAQSLSMAVKQMKGGSARILNQSIEENTMNIKWTTKYFARSFSKKSLGRVRRYIWRQQKHHNRHHRASALNEELRSFFLDHPNP